MRAKDCVRKPGFNRKQDKYLLHWSLNSNERKQQWIDKLIWHMLMVNPKKKKKSGYRLKSTWECGGMLMNRVIKRGHWLGGAHEQDGEESVPQEACWEAGQGGMSRWKRQWQTDAPGQGVKWKAGLWTEILRTRKEGARRVSGRRNTKAGTLLGKPG